MNSTLDHGREAQAVELEVRRLAEMLVEQVNKVNDIAQLLVARIEGKEPHNDGGQ